MKNGPKVSVVMAVYNGGRYLSEAVQSVLDQTFEDFEFLVVDDGSTDKTGQILDKYVKQDKRVRVIKQNHGGLWLGLNRGIEEARGELVARMDGDDISLKQRFARQVKYFQEHPECVALGTWVREIDPLGLMLGAVVRPTEHEEIDGAFLRGEGGVIAHPTAMIRKEALVKIGGYHQFATAQDMDLFLRLGEVGRLANLPEVLLLYRQHWESMSLARRSEQVRETVNIVALARQRRGLTAEMIAEEKVKQMVSDVTLVEADRYRSWALHAIKNGNRMGAMLHASCLVRHRPWRLESWKILRWAMAA